MAWRHQSRRLWVALIALVATGGATFVAAPSSGAADATPTVANRAGVIVDQGNGTVRRVGITFTGTITGLAALQLAGFSPSVRSFGGVGGAVCALDIARVHYGCPTDASCLTCAAPDYWAYARAPAGTQTFVVSRVGGGATEVHDGDVEGWRWGTGATPAYVPLDRIFPPTTTSTSPTSPPPPPPPRTTTSHASGPGPTATSRVGVQTSRTTLAPTGASTGATTGPISPTTVRAGGADATTSTRAGAPPSAPRSAHDTTPRSASNGRRATNRTLAAAPPTVAGGAGGSPFAWIGFALVLAALGVAIFAARRRSRHAAPSG